MESSRRRFKWTSEEPCPMESPLASGPRPTPDGVDFPLVGPQRNLEPADRTSRPGVRSPQAPADLRAQSATNKVLEPPLAAVQDSTGRRWILTGWEPLDRVWQNPPVPSSTRTPDSGLSSRRNQEARGDCGSTRAMIPRRNGPGDWGTSILGGIAKGTPARTDSRQTGGATFDDSVASQFTQVRPP